MIYLIKISECVCRYMSEYISDWIRKRSLDRTSSDLAFRPFLKWFDRNMEELFTKAAQQVRYNFYFLSVLILVFRHH